MEWGLGHSNKIVGFWSAMNLLTKALGVCDNKRTTELPAIELLVSPKLEITIYQRDIENDEFLLLACSGVFSVMSNEEVISCVSPVGVFW